MKAENSAPVSSPNPGNAYPPAVRANAHPGKILKVSLESACFGSAVVLHCHEGYISRGDGRILAGLIAEVLPSARRMIVDFSAVQSLDSDALGELVMIHLWAEAAGYALPFASPSDSLRDLFENTHLISIFDVYASVDEAIRAMRQEQVQPA